MVRRALKSFGTYKAPGPDGIQPIALLELPDEIIEVLAGLFSLCIENRYTPKCWRKNKVIFIPKVGKDNYGNPKAFRPITLSNFLLKVLERIIQWHIKVTSFPVPLFNQHAFTPGRSCDSALSTVTDLIEKTAMRGQYCLAAFLDIEGAFDNLSFTSIRRELLAAGT